MTVQLCMKSGSIGPCGWVSRFKPWKFYKGNTYDARPRATPCLWRSDQFTWRTHSIVNTLERVSWPWLKKIIVLEVRVRERFYALRACVKMCQVWNWIDFMIELRIECVFAWWIRSQEIAFLSTRKTLGFRLIDGRYAMKEDANAWCKPKFSPFLTRSSFLEPPERFSKTHWNSFAIRRNCVC